MSDALRPGEPVEGEYTDSELPLDAEDDGLGDTEEVDVEVIEIVDDGSEYPPGRDTAL